MLRLTKQADYAIVLLTHFALAPDGAVLSARDLAAESRLPMPIVSKVLKALARGGILASQRGVNGGYRLARTPAEVTVAQVIAALEGPIAVSACSADLGCAHEPHCAARPPLQRLNLLVLGVLERVSLAEVVKPPFDGRHSAPRFPKLSPVLAHAPASGTGDGSAASSLADPDRDAPADARTPPVPVPE